MAKLKFNLHTPAFFTTAITLSAVTAIAEEQDLRCGQPFPATYLPTLDGKLQSVDSFRGRKLMLHVFASW